MTNELQDKVALVTGGSRGIGLAIAKELALAGARVAVVARHQEGAVKAATQLHGTGHEGFGCDVSSKSDVDGLTKTVTEHLGVVQILVNNAGIARDNIFIRMTKEQWDEVLDINLTGVFNVTKAFARKMLKTKDASILNISSVVGLTGNAGQANYSASKAGLIGLTKSLAKELASRNVRCNAITPGFIESDMTDVLPESVTNDLSSKIPLGYFGAPSDVAGLARFLSGPYARYITGQVISVDGGLAMH
ncbi:MAG: 3-oxoacyl-[acyl-carrier-protein] reductase [Gemmatimonadetes bacterium]|nr:3-oxoacyl-[acyl-carrier-protein] reductase [Gemmatimonadota bacterium]|tara:strand:- start:733 stop:1476 length:744 start_codon:yes stop_codon:yes gene_type:complete